MVNCQRVNQGTLTDGKGSVQLTSLCQLVQINVCREIGLPLLNVNKSSRHSGGRLAWPKRHPLGKANSTGKPPDQICKQSWVMNLSLYKYWSRSVAFVIVNNIYFFTKQATSIKSSFVPSLPLRSEFPVSCTVWSFYGLVVFLMTTYSGLYYKLIAIINDDFWWRYKLRRRVYDRNWQH